MSSYIRTFSGRKIEPLNPDPEQICIEDIAHALSNVCRYTGHTRSFYSVAQHSVYVARQVPLDLALWGLLHDASEAYLSDIARPLKTQETFRLYRAAEARLMDAVCVRFGLRPSLEPAAVKTADRRMLRTEQRDLMSGSDWQHDTDNPPYEFTVFPLGPEAAKMFFLTEYNYLRHYKR